MAVENTDGSMDDFPGWIPNLNLRDLAQLVKFEPRCVPSTLNDPELEKKPGIQGGPLLAGRNLRIQLSPARSAAAASSPGTPEPAAVTQIPVSSAPAKSSRGLLLKLGVAALVLIGLVVFAWVVMKSSDYSGVSIIKGERFENDHLAVELGKTLPPFSGLLLVDEPQS